MEENINTERGLGRVDNPLFPEDRIRGIIDYYSTLLVPLEGALGYTGEEVEKLWEDNLGERKNWEEMYSTLKEIGDSWRGLLEEFVSPDTTEERQKEIQRYTEEWYLNFTLLYEFNKGGGEPLPTKIPPYRINIDPKTGERTESHETEKLWGDYYFIPGRGILKILKDKKGRALEELRKLSQTPTPTRIEIPKDLMQSQTQSVGDTLKYITDPKKKEAIQKLQREGKLLAGTLEGLSGGKGYLKSFTIALAQTLKEQSKYYNTDGDFTGVPVSLIPEIFGEGVEAKETYLPLKVRTKGGDKEEERPAPYILVSYEALARKMKGEGKKVGGQDIKYIQNYIRELSGKQYLLDVGGGAILGIPFLTKTLVIYREDSGKEIGCLLNLSPQFSKTIRGYTTLRGDTLQRIGGGRQKDITMNLLDLLLYVRGVNIQRGREEEEDTPSYFRKNKEELLSQIATSKRYKRQKGERERDFKEAIQKVKDSGLILGYREESGGRISVFTFNPYYSKKGGESPEEQTGEK